MNMLKQQVTHRKYGAGTVTSLNGSVITVFFEQYGSHSFRYPDAFLKDLRATQPEVQRFAEEAAEQET